jgi:hypothetical protein
MADTEDMQENEEQSNGHGGTAVAKKTVVTAAAIAAASGATALAAKKALGDRATDDESKPARRKSSSSDDSLLGTAMTSAWDSARDSLVPMIEDAATHAGEYVARHSPDLVRDSIVPRFIRGFERARGSSDDE